MKSVIRLMVVLAVVGSGFGCADGSKIATILPVDESTEAKPSPVSKGTEEIIAPKSETPDVPTTEAPKSPETPKAPTGDGTKPGEPSGPSGEIPALPPPVKTPDPIFISLAPGVVFPKEPLPPPVVTGVDVLNGPLDLLSSIETPEAAGSSEGEVRIFRCGDDAIVTGFEYAHEAVDTGCGEGDYSGCGPEIHLAALKLTCTPLTIVGAANDRSNPASVWPTTQTVAGKTDAAMNSDASKTNCKAGVGIATGIFGRVDSELKSFGLTCGHFHAWKEGVAVLPTFNKTASAEDWGGAEYAASPGWDGSPFKTSCDTNQAVVGMSVKFSGTRVLGITDIQCADVKPVTMKTIFPIER